MSRFELCKNCKFFDSHIDDENHFGECRRYAPKPMVKDQILDKDPWAYWPLVNMYEWCGEFESE